MASGDNLKRLMGTYTVENYNRLMAECAKRKSQEGSSVAASRILNELIQAHLPPTAIDYYGERIAWRQERRRIKKKSLSRYA